MAAYAVEDFTFGSGSVAEVAALIETKLETIDDSKVIHHLDIIVDSRNKDEVTGVLIIDA